MTDRPQGLGKGVWGNFRFCMIFLAILSNLRPWEEVRSEKYSSGYLDLVLRLEFGVDHLQKYAEY